MESRSKSVGAEMHISLTSTTPPIHRKTSSLFKHFDKTQHLSDDLRSEGRSPIRKRLSFCARSLGGGSDKIVKKPSQSGFVHSVGKQFSLSRLRGRVRSRPKKQSSIEVDSDQLSLDVCTETGQVSGETLLQINVEKDKELERRVPTVVVVDVEPVSNGMANGCDIDQSENQKLTKEKDDETILSEEPDPTTHLIDDRVLEEV